MSTETMVKEDVEKESGPQLVVVELARRRSPEQIKRLRRGRGRLVDDIDDTLLELVKSGTISADAQPVVIVVREALGSSLLWPLGQDEDDDDDERDEDEDDDDEDDDDDDDEDHDEDHR